ncbi:MAG: Rpn family recombination-promoting nuclease/putative transposase [Eubacterium sp.]|nr:Rpn family recombination-promoting nuclease/putative transposase [Eubacterium sp.]
MTDKMEKTFDELTFNDDFMFCKVLSTNPDLCKELVEMITGRKVSGLPAVNNQLPIKITEDGKGVRFDVYFEDQKNVIYDIEMQTSSLKYLPERTRYYQGMIDLNTIEKGENYDKLKQTYIIFVCPFDPFGADRYKYTFRNLCCENPDIELNDKSEKIFLNASGSIGDISEDLKGFLLYVADNKVINKYTERLEKAVERVREHDEWRVEYMTLAMKYLEKEEEGREKQHALDVQTLTKRLMERHPDWSLEDAKKEAEELLKVF